MEFKFSGLPLIALAVGFVVVFAVPVYLAARMVGAANATLMRSSLSLIVGTGLALASVIFGGVVAFVLVPASFLVAFKFVLGATFVEAFLLGVLALIGCALIVKFFAGAVTATFGGASV